MQGASLSAQELAYFNRTVPTIESVCIDLTNLHQQTQLSSFNSWLVSEDSIIARIKPLASFTQDVEHDLRALSHQTVDFLHYGYLAPVADFEGDQVPVILTHTERSKYNGTLISIDYQTRPWYSLLDPTQAFKAVAGPLAKFLASRSTQAASSTTTAPNVTVSNTANGWQIVYQPYYASTENGLGGPSTPVSGYVSPGRYRFGIKKTAPAQWDTTSWNIPANPNIHVPLP